MSTSIDLLKTGHELMKQFASDAHNGPVENWLSDVAVFLHNQTRTPEQVLVSGKVREAELGPDEDGEYMEIDGYETQTYKDMKLSDIMDKYLETYNTCSKELAQLTFVEVGTTAQFKLGNYAIGYLTVVG